ASPVRELGLASLAAAGGSPCRGARGQRLGGHQQRAWGGALPPPGLRALVRGRLPPDGAGAPGRERLPGTGAWRHGNRLALGLLLGRGAALTGPLSGRR